MKWVKELCWTEVHVYNFPFWYDNMHRPWFPCESWRNTSRPGFLDSFIPLFPFCPTESKNKLFGQILKHIPPIDSLFMSLMKSVSSIIHHTHTCWRTLESREFPDEVYISELSRYHYRSLYSECTHIQRYRSTTGTIVIRWFSTFSFYSFLMINWEIRDKPLFQRLVSISRSSVHCPRGHLSFSVNLTTVDLRLCNLPNDPGIVDGFLKITFFSPVFIPSLSIVRHPICR